MYRLFRKAYKWPPEKVDHLDITRIKRIFDELTEDSEKKGSNFDEDDFE